MRRGGRHTQWSQSDSPPLPERSSEGAHGPWPLEFRAYYTTGRTRTALVGIKDAKNPPIVAALLEALRRSNSEPGGLTSHESVMTYVAAVRVFDQELSRMKAPAGAVPAWRYYEDEPVTRVQAAEDVRGSHINQFERELRKRYSAKSRTPYRYVERVVALLGRVSKEGIVPLSQSLTERLQYTTDGPVGEDVPVSPLSASVVRQLVAAARTEVKAVLRRLGPELDERLKSGEDPRIGGWDRAENIIWEIAHSGCVPARSLIEKVGKRRADEIRVTELHPLVFPTHEDLVPFAVLICLETREPIECIRDLTEDCLSNIHEGWATLETYKGRARGNENHSPRIRCAGLFTPGRLILEVLRITLRMRQHNPSPYLWLHWWRQGITRATLRRQTSHDPWDAFLAKHLILDDSGKRILHFPDLRSMRKAGKARRYRASGGALPEFADDNSPKVANSAYGEVPEHRDLHLDTVTEAQADALRPSTLLGPKILTPEMERQALEDPASVAATLGVDVNTLRKALRGDLDTQVGVCTDFFSSPFTPEGEPCGEDRGESLWACVMCTNGLIPERKLPAIILRLDDILYRREALPQEHWERKYGLAYRSITKGILPRFSAEVIDRARAIASNGEVDLLLPIQLMSE